MPEKPKKRNKGLKRSLGVFSVFSICTGVAFSSFFLLPGIATGETGPALPLAFFSAAILMLPAILSLSELSSAMPRSGGPYFFITRSFGPLPGLIGALGKFTQLILKGTFAFVGFGIYLSLILKVPIQLTAVILIIIFTLVNLFGTRQTAKTERVLVAILLLVLSYFLLAGTGEILSGESDLKRQFRPLFPYGWEGFVSAIAIVFISFGGVAQVASVAEEVKNPAGTLPRGMLLSLGISSFFYIAGSMLMIAILSADTLRGDETPAATVTEYITALPFPVIIMVFAALAAFASTGNAAILAASRYPLALARDRLFWKRFGKLTKNGVPRNAVLLAGALSIGLVLLLDVKQIAKTASAFLLFVFLLMCLAVIIFRESRKQEYNPGFRSPFYPWVQIAGCIIYIWLIWASGAGAMAFIAGVFLISFLWYAFGVKEKPRLSAAIYYLFGRMAREGTRISQSGSFNISLGRSNLASVVEHAIFIDLDEEKQFEEAVQEAAVALEKRVGGKQKEIAESLKEEVRHWKNPVRFNISAAPALLQGIEQPEMILIRGKIRIHDGYIRGLIVVVDDEESSDRLLQLIAQLEITIHHRDFPNAWEKAANAKEIKRALIHDVGSLSIGIQDSAPTKHLIGTKTKDVDLPQHSLIGAIYREGKLIVPDDETEIKKDDELIIIAQGEAYDRLSEKFSSVLIE